MVTVALVEFDVAQARINCNVHPDKIHRQLSSSRLANGRLHAYHSVIAMSLLHPTLLILTLFIVLRLRSMKIKLPFYQKRCHHSFYGVGVGGTTRPRLTLKTIAMMFKKCEMYLLVMLYAYRSVITISKLHPALLILTLFIVLHIRSVLNFHLHFSYRTYMRSFKLNSHHKRCHHSYKTTSYRSQPTLKTTVVMFGYAEEGEMYLLAIIHQRLIISGDVELNPGPLGELDLRNVTNELSSVKAKWHTIGVQLGIDPAKLEEIENNYQKADRRFSEVIKFWLRGNTRVAMSWESLMEVLESPFVGEKGLAGRLREKGGMIISENVSVPGATESGVQPQESNGGQRGSTEENLDERQDIVSLPALEHIEMAEKKEKPVGTKLESHLAEEAGYSDDSTAKPITRKKKNTRKRHHALTPDSVLKELKEVDWETLYRVLELPVSQRQKIKRMYVSEEERKSAGVLWWVDHHPLASWRLLITQLDKEGKHSLANRIRQYAEKITDSSFTCKEISMVTATLDDHELADILLIMPRSIQDEIREKTSTSADFRKGLIELYRQYSSRATWEDLAGRLYYHWKDGKALAAAKRFIKERPETLNLQNLNTLLERVSHDWYDIGYWIRIPRSKLNEIRRQHSGDAQRCSHACWEVYLKDHPSPTWQRVAVALYMKDHLEELEMILKKYLKSSAENLRQFEEAMKHGHIRSWMWKLLLYGAAGSGKSSVKEMILGNPPPVNRTSTRLAMRPTTVYRINLDDKEFTTITTLQERRVFLARALLQSAPNLKRRLRTAQSKVASSSSDQPISTVAVSQIQSKDQASPDQPPSASLLEPASLDHRESDEDIDSEVDDILQSISTDWELVKLMDGMSTTVHVDPLACFKLIQMIDAGGQPQFHEILPVFLRNLSYYIFVFRLCDDLVTHPVVEFYVDGKPVGSPFTSAQSIEQLLQHCIRCIHSHRPPTGSQSECPQIMVIGTHVDHEKKSSESRDEKNRKILTHLSPLDRKQIMFHNASEKKVFFPVNARFPGDAEDKIVKQVRQGLFCTDLFTPVDIPSRWFALEILLGEMAQALERGVLSKEDCITAAVEKLHFEEDAVDAALQYLDQVSAIMYYPKILPNVVFADPQIVLDKISELVFKSVEMEKLSKEQALTGDWIKFHDFALVTIKFLSKGDFKIHYVPGLFEVGDLAYLFKKLLVFATFSESEYFVPALLRHLDGQAVDDHRVRCIPSLVLLFPGGGPRQGIFCALLCWLVSPENDSPAPWSISVDDLGSPLCLYRNCVQFDVPDSLSTVALIDTYTHFEVHGDVPEEFPLLRKAIEKGLRKAALSLGYFNSSPSPALLCPCGRGEAHVAEIVKSTHWKCSLKSVAKKFDKLSSDQQLWLEYTPSTDEKSKLSECDLSKLLCQLNPHASKWREIGTHLGFHQGELKIIQGKLYLMNGDKGRLREMLREWLEWAPGDSRGSSSSASIECLKCALDKSGLAQTALEVESCFTQSALVLEVASELPPIKRPKIDTLASNSVT